MIQRTQESTDPRINGSKEHPRRTNNNPGSQAESPTRRTGNLPIHQENIMATKTTAKAKTEIKDEVKSLRDRAIDAQKRVIDFQESAFDRTFEAFVSLRERQEEAVTNWLDKAERVPTEVKEATHQWINFARTTRQTYRDAVAKNFDLATQWVEGRRQTA
jgi:hypothetical protein